MVVRKAVILPTMTPAMILPMRTSVERLTMHLFIERAIVRISRPGVEGKAR